MATYNGSSANNTVVGALEQDNEFIGFGAGVDVLTGGNRRDVFRMSFDPATDTVNGGAGQDMVDYSASSRGLQIDLNGSGNTGTVRFVTSLTYIPPGSTTPLTVTTIVPVANLSGIEDVVGTAYGDGITGSSLDNVLDGGNGGDTIKGLTGNDTLLGGYGSDKLFGGTGRNTIDGGNDADSITLELEHLGTTASRDTIAGGEGIDTLFFEENLAGEYGVRVTLDSGGLQGTVELAPLHRDRLHGPHARRGYSHRHRGCHGHGAGRCDPGQRSGQRAQRDGRRRHSRRRRRAGHRQRRRRRRYHPGFLR